MKAFIRLVNGECIHHGSIVYAELGFSNGEEDTTTMIKGRLCINENLTDNSRFLYICQDECDGDAGANDKFEFRHSWSFILDMDGNISSSDVFYLSSHPMDADAEQVLAPPPVDVDVDDDPMPEDWVMIEDLPF